MSKKSTPKFLKTKTSTVNLHSPRDENESEEVELKLDAEDPLTRLMDVCVSGGFKPRFKWYFFKNRIMGECEIIFYDPCFNRPPIRRVLASRSFFFPRSTTIENVKRSLSWLILNDIGLMNDESSEEEQSMNEENVKTFNKVLNNSFGLMGKVLEKVYESSDFQNDSTSRSKKKWSDQVDEEE